MFLFLNHDSPSTMKKRTTVTRMLVIFVTEAELYTKAAILGGDSAGLAQPGAPWRGLARSFRWLDKTRNVIKLLYIYIYI